MPDDNEIVLERPVWAVAPATAAERCAAFVAQTVAQASARGVVVGLSGGIDSAVSAAVAVKGLGSERVRGVLLPYRTSSPASLADGQAVADFLGIATELVEITPFVDAFLQHRPDADAIRAGNVMARMRMITLYDTSRRDHTLVLGTGNRTEWLLGYTTLHGDAACGLNPVGQLYKTEIRLLADHLGLPRAVLTKRPSADLWENQADEDELGFTYAEADRLLHHLVDEGLARRQLTTLGFAPPVIDAVTSRLQAMRFKRNLPPVCDFGRRAPGPG